MTRIWRPLFLALTLSAVPGCFFLLLMAPKTTAAALPDRAGKAVYVRRCSTCHALIEPTAFRHRLGDVVYRYRDKKILTTAEQNAIFEYLTPFPDSQGRFLPAPTPTPVPAATAPPAESPVPEPPTAAPDQPDEMPLPEPASTDEPELPSEVEGP
jgi:hypothetical protein